MDPVFTGSSLKKSDPLRPDHHRDPAKRSSIIAFHCRQGRVKYHPGPDRAAAFQLEQCPRQKQADLLFRVFKAAAAEFITVSADNLHSPVNRDHLLRIPVRIRLSPLNGQKDLTGIRFFIRTIGFHSAPLNQTHIQRAHFTSYTLKTNAYPADTLLRLTL